MSTPIVRAPSSHGQAPPTRRLQSRIDLGAVEIAGKVFELTWLAAGDTDTVIVDVRVYKPSRVGTVIGLDGDHPRIVVTHQMYQYWVDRYGHLLVAEVAAAYANRPQS